MQIREVTFPEPILAAQRDGTLVIFAGAGVSMPPPSNYPNFRQLAVEIADNTLTLRGNEPLDRFLGQLENRKVSVHQRACEILSNPESRPNPLHHSVLKLFQSSSQVRIVTTNFDNHFTIAAKEIFGDEVEYYCGPALPLGDDFHGIVYLHGSVEKEPENLVLTDSDFGRAYLTQGWARRFLRALFARYTVLFIGYSHNDTVMNYLARGLPPDTSSQRFALTYENPDGYWDFLGIAPILYPLRDDENRHAELGESLAAWVQLSQMGALDHEQRIRDIVQLPPPLDRESTDYIEDALKDIATTRFFTRYARLPEWLQWAENKENFQSLFRPESQVDQVSYQLAIWFATEFVRQRPYESLAVVQRRGQRIHSSLWALIVRNLFDDEARPNPSIVTLWVAVLLQFPPHNYSQYNPLSPVLYKFKHPDENAAALLVFEYLTEPHISLKQSIRLPGDESVDRPVGAEIVYRGDHYWLKKAWEEFFRPNIASFAEDLEPILSSHLKKANLLLKETKGPDEYFDSMNFRRSTIEASIGNNLRSIVDVVIDAARDVIEWILENNFDNAVSIIARWIKSDVLLLRRLAIHGISKSEVLTPEQKLKWLQDKRLLYTYGLKHEVFRLMENAYPGSSEEIRIEFLEHVCRGPEVEDAQGINERTYQYEIYNVLVWLNKTAPECSHSREKLEAMQQEHPDFAPREYPDLDHRFGGVQRVATESRVTVEEILSRDPEEQVNMLLTYMDEGAFGSTREGLLTIVAEAVAQSYQWGWSLAGLLRERDEWDSDLWESLLRGWRKGVLTAQQWTEIFSLLLENNQLNAFARPIAYLLEDSVKREEGAIPFECIPLGLSVAESLWDSYSGESSIELGESKSWLQKAINRIGGQLAEFWLHALSRKRASITDSWVGIPEEFKRFSHMILSGISPSAELGRVVLISRLHFLFALDAEWARARIIPLLDWSRDPRQAQQAWHGFLSWGRWNEALLPELIPLYEKTFPHLSDLGDLRGQFSEHLASIVLFSSHNPSEDRWLEKFLTDGNSEDRNCWASQIGYLLAELKEDAIQNLWDSWMRDYWGRRITGIPLQLDEKETETMIGWSVSLKPVFTGVVEKIRQSPAPPLADTVLYRHFVDNDFATSHPEALTQLLLHLLPNASEPFWQCDDAEKLIEKLLGSDVSKENLRRLCNQLSRLGSRRAIEFVNRIEE